MGRAGKGGIRGIASVLGALALAAGCGGTASDPATGSEGVAPYGLRGRIVTTAGAPVADASVTLTRLADGAVLTEMQSHPDGWFAFLVFDGRYRVDVAAPGYAITPAGEEATVDGWDVDMPIFVASPAP